jgi:Skp family chaperone for outer membrane proteins
MSKSLAWWRLLVISCVVACIVAAMAASGEQAGKTSATFATVDIQKVNAQFKAMQLAVANMQEMQAKFSARLQRRQGMVFLTKEEHDQLDAAVEKKPQADADKAAVKQLQDKASQLKGEYDTLAQKPDKDLTADDRQRIKDKQAAIQKAGQDFEKTRDDLNNQLKSFDSDNTDSLDKQLRAAVKKVAEQKGYTIVFNSQIALYAGTDISEAVIGELNKKP